MRLRPLAASIAAALLVLSPAIAVQPHPVQHTWNGDLTLDQAIRLALKQNPNVLKALWQIEQTRGQIIEVRSEALPHVALTSSYFQQSKSLLAGRGGNLSNSTAGTNNTGSNSFNTSDLSKQLANIPGVSQSAAGQVASAVQNSVSQAQGSQPSTSSFGGGDISWNVDVQVTQTLYAGGAIRSAINIAKFTDDSSYFNLRDVIDQTIDTVRQQFYTVLLNRELIKVQEESVKLLEDQLKESSRTVSKPAQCRVSTCCKARSHWRTSSRN
ncbi:hypothetical protein CfE428DRAFT_5938 [Chthoniobacter flavus Ellin428]|uniref:Outer membrane efflux protein n=1 Tax=Chthoniobacter flavus Ellin428 TaxID=497964 RepID=B4DAJ7_9BACT|nr:TolC family protein [Chthoniobacter flavus]EDY16515.1 hypothetical protein CfE428DRAFT_5938 [Chthoniobacter flavus Ellin428]